MTPANSDTIYSLYCKAARTTARILKEAASAHSWPPSFGLVSTPPAWETEKATLLRAARQLESLADLVDAIAEDLQPAPAADAAPAAPNSNFFRDYCDLCGTPTRGQAIFDKHGGRVYYIPLDHRPPPHGS